MTATLDQVDQATVEKRTDLPHQLAAARVASNRLYAVVVLLAIALLSSVWIMYSMFAKVDQRTEVMTVKMYPNGTWDVARDAFSTPTEFFPATVDHLLTRYVETRFGQIPSTISRDYGEAQLFMDPTLAAQFVSTGVEGFNAAQKAADVAAKPASADRIDIVMTAPPDHYDRLDGTFTEGKRPVVRTNVYFTESTIAADGHQKGPPRKKILRLQWTLLPKKELQTRSQEWLSLNPIGLQVISQNLIDDPSADYVAPQETEQ